MNRRRRLPAAFLFRFAKKGMMPAKKGADTSPI